MPKDIAITYETLFELLRIEKNREDLQKLDETFFEDVLAYLKDKKAHFDSRPVAQTTLFERDEREIVRLELENIRKILKDLYDRREKKIVTTALNKAKTGVALMNTANMLPEEKKLFILMSSDLCEFRKGILNRLVCYQLPELPGQLNRDLCDMDRQASEACEGEPEAAQSPEITGGYSEDAPLTADTHFKTNAEEPLSSYPPKELKTASYSGTEGRSGKMIRFLEPIGEIVGPDLQIYGPYTEGEEISLPNELARVLLEKNQAEEI